MNSDPTPPPVPPSSPGPSPAAPTPVGRGWWQRNWKWFVPTGCLTMIVVVALFVMGIVLVVFGAMKSADVYKIALHRAQTNPKVQQALGAPIHDGLIMSGHVNTNGGAGEADLSIPIAGSKGKGTIYLVATKSAGEWQYSTLVVKTDNGETINLNQPTPASEDKD